MIVASPTYFRIAADFHGRAAHAGLRPEDGRCAILAAAHAVAAMPHGRIDEQTTANVGSLHGGVGSTNVVARALPAPGGGALDRRRSGRGARGRDDRRGPGRRGGGGVRRGRRLRPAVRGVPAEAVQPAVVAAEAALRVCGYEPSRIATGGGSDANVLVAEGLPCVNLANGTERNHEPTERVSVVALEGMLDVALRLLDEAAAV